MRDAMDVSVVIPTFNEAENLPVLLPRLFSALEGAGLAGEVVVADDASPDGTADSAEEILAGRGRVLRRTGPRGLAHAVAEGFEASAAPLLCVMDADLSHPPETVPALVRAVLDGADLAVGSRYVPGGGVEDWPWRRRLASRAACWLARPLTGIRDATSGFFCVRRSAVEGLSLSTAGYKIGLEVFVRGRVGRWVEVPFVFRDRAAGQSKLGSRVMWQYLAQCLRLAAGRLRHRRGG